MSKNKTEEGLRTRFWLTIAAAIAARVALGLFFAVSGMQKAASPIQEFEVVVEAYQVLPEDYTSLFAATAPWFELLLGLCLAAGLYTRFSALGIAAMLLAFIAALLSTLARKIPLDNCGCFGGMMTLSPRQAILLDCFLLLLAYLSYRHGQSILSLDHWTKQGETNSSIA